VLLLPRSVRIYLAAEPIDLRKSIDGLAALVGAKGHDVYSGHLYVFGGRRRDRVKILTFDRGGFVLLYKRLESGRFRWPVAGGPRCLAGPRCQRRRAKSRWTPRNWRCCSTASTCAR